MDEGSGYCGSGGGIESIGCGEDREYGMIAVRERDEICLEKDSVESNMKLIFLADRLGVMGLVLGREGEREGLTILEVC